MAGYDVIVGMGSNLGDRAGTLTAAVEDLAERARLFAGSALYETEPMGGPPQHAFLNAAVGVAWDSDLDDLLGEIQRIEARHGRDARARAAEPRWGPRLLDLDILWARRAEQTSKLNDRSLGPDQSLGIVICEGPQLVVPHPRLHQRAFALRPLLDVNPDAMDPRTTRSYAVILSELKHQRISKFAFPRWPFSCLPVD